MSNWTEHLIGLANLESNAGKRVAFETSAIMIGDLRKENQQLKQRIAELERENEEQKAALEIVATKLNLKSSDCNFVHWIDEALANLYIEQQIKGFELGYWFARKTYADCMKRTHGGEWEADKAILNEKLEQLRKGGE